MGRKPVLFAATLLLTSVGATSLHGQDVLSANPEFWGRNASKPRATTDTTGASVSAQVSSLVNSARDAEKKNDIAAARVLYEQALNLEPTNRVALLSFARMLHRVGDLDASIGMYYQSLENHRDDPVAMNDLALCYARKGELRRALAMLNGAISLKPDSPRYRNNIAKILLELGRPNDAFAHLVEANGPAAGHYNMAKLLGQRGQTAEAIQYLEISTQMDPTFEPATNLLAQARAQPKATAPAAGQVFARLPAVDQEGDSVSELPPKTSSTDSALANNDSTLIPPTETSSTIGGSTELLPPTSPSEEVRTFESTASLNPDDGVRSPWEPGSIRLQSAELVDELNAGDVDWAADFEELELAPTSAPIPFDARRRYTEERNSADSVGQYLDGFKAEKP